MKRDLEIVCGPRLDLDDRFRGGATISTVIDDLVGDLVEDCEDKPAMQPQRQRTGAAAQVQHSRCGPQCERGDRVCKNHLEVGSDGVPDGLAEQCLVHRSVGHAVSDNGVEVLSNHLLDSNGDAGGEGGSVTGTGKEEKEELF